MHPLHPPLCLPLHTDVPQDAFDILRGKKHFRAMAAILSAHRYLRTKFTITNLLFRYFISGSLPRCLIARFSFPRFLFAGATLRVAEHLQ